MLKVCPMIAAIFGLAIVVCFMPSEQFFSHIMARTSYILMK
jgi:hypothetical protein